VSASPRLAVPASRWVTFTLEGQRYALPLESVHRALRAVEITPLPLAPDAVAGAIDVGGRTLPVFSLRVRLRLPERPLQVSDQLIIARTSRRDVVLVVDSVLELIDAPLDALSAPLPLTGNLAHLSGVLALPDGMVFIEDLERFLSPEEDRALDSALREAGVDRAR